MEWWRGITYQDKSVITALLSCDGIGPKTIQHLFQFINDHQLCSLDFWNEPKLYSEKFRLSEHQLAGINEFKNNYSINSYLQYLSSKEINRVFPDEPLYPPLLLQIPSPPAMLFVKGNLDFVHDFPVAVVGSRSMTTYGKTATELIVSQLVSIGAQIVSGGMYGIDTQAHLTCLAQHGQTVCVLGYGFDHCYPDTHQAFFEELLEKGGTIITEFAPSVVPKPGNFPQRNRIVAGMCLGTVVVEAAKKSGSQITARLAAEYGREVFAVPGDITNPYAEGTKALINEGATLISSAADIVSELQQNYENLATTITDKNILNTTNFTDEKEQNKVEKFESQHHQRLYQLLHTHPQTTDELCQMLQLPFVSLSLLLTDLELEGLIENTGEVWQCK